VDFHAILPTVNALGRPASGACQDPDEGVAAEEFANDAAAEVSSGSGDEDGDSSDDVLFSLGFVGAAPAGELVGAPPVARMQARSRTAMPAAAPSGPGRRHSSLALMQKQYLAPGRWPTFNFKKAQRLDAEMGAVAFAERWLTESTLSALTHRKPPLSWICCLI